MNKKIIFGILAVVVIGGGFWAYEFVLGPTKPASGPITAVPLEPSKPSSQATPSSKPAGTATAPDPLKMLEPQPSAGTPPANPVAAATAPAATTAPAPQPPAGQPIASGEKIFKIGQDKSRAQFSIHETLRGKPVDAIGSTSQVAGEIAINLADLSKTRAGQIRVDARTLATDDQRRNQAIKNRILNTNNYEFITFNPKEVIGLTGAAKPGDTFNFKLAGDLTIKDVTKPAVFDMTMKVDSADQVSGKATTTVKRADYNIIVPNLPFLANVADEVKINIEGVAAAGK